MKTMEVQIDNEEVQAEVFEPLPDYGEIEGEKVKLSGLDYSLIKHETAKQRKEELLSRLKNRLNQFTHRMPLASALQQLGKTSQNDQLSRNIQLASAPKPSIDAATFYLFPTQLHFAPHLPQLITRRFGKMHVAPLYIHHPQQDVDTLRQLITKDDRIKDTNRKRQADAARVVGALYSDASDSQDDIFAQDKQEEQEQDRQQLKNKQRAAPAIKVGSKLSFGVGEDEIFGGKHYKEGLQERAQIEPTVQKDRYQFIHKKQKLNEQDYGECYQQLGPSLEEMKQLRKEGIQLYGDQKQYVQKERKYNVHQDYEKIKRIIDEKSKPKP